jgi:hypothetical protein
MARVAQELRQRRQVSRQKAATAAIQLICDVWEWEDETRPSRPLDVYLAAVKKALQKLEGGERIQQIDLGAALLDDAVEGAIQYLDR